MRTAADDTGNMHRLRSTPFVVVAVGLLSCAAARDDRPSAAACKRYRDHAIDLRLTATMGPTIADEVLAIHRRQLAQAVGSALVERCENRITADEYACSLAAMNQDQLVACTATHVAGGAQ